MYNLLNFGGGVAGYHDMQALLDHSFALKMFSGDVWRFTVSDLFVLLALGMLFIETIKAARHSRNWRDHAAMPILRGAGGIHCAGKFSTSAFS